MWYVWCVIFQAALYEEWIELAPSHIQTPSWYDWKLRKMRKKHNDPQRDKIYLRTGTPSQDSDQPAHSRILIRVFAGRSLERQGFNTFTSGQQRLIRMRGRAGWSQCSLGAHVRRYVFLPSNTFWLCGPHYTVRVITGQRSSPESRFLSNNCTIWASACQNLPECVTSKDIGQPVHQPSLARVLVYPFLDSPEAVEDTCNQRELWSDSADAQADLSFHWWHKCWFCRPLTHICFSKYETLTSRSHIEVGIVQHKSSDQYLKARQV